VVRGANILQDYWNAPEETAKRFHGADAVLYFVDLLRRDEEGVLNFVTRKSD
jgi:long-subunit acyl-CoA synthetase (AMP-forming)